MVDDNKNIKNNKNQDSYILSEEDFYPPEDNRKYRSYISSVYGGDNFYDYFEWFYDMYEDEFFEN